MWGRGCVMQHWHEEARARYRQEPFWEASCVGYFISPRNVDTKMKSGKIGFPVPWKWAYARYSGYGGIMSNSTLQVIVYIASIALQVIVYIASIALMFIGGVTLAVTLDLDPVLGAIFLWSILTVVVAETLSSLVYKK